jgi:hypothetical protein
MTKSPTLGAKVPFYEKDNRWNVELYDTNGSLIFPCENDEMTPAHFVPKLSNVACVLQCGGIWIGGKGWGVTWKLVQAVVKPKEVVTVFGKCHIKLSEDEKNTIENDDAEAEEEVLVPEPKAAAQTMVEDSDEEEEAPKPKPEPKVVAKPAVAPAPAPEEEKPVVVVTAAAAPVEKKIVKKVVKKA